MLTDDEARKFWDVYDELTRQYGHDWRKGQTLMNALGRVQPDAYTMIHGTSADCFYRDDRIDAFCSYLFWKG